MSTETLTAPAPTVTESKLKSTPKPESLNSLSVERNGVSLSFNPVQIKKGKTAGTWYLAPDVSNWTLFVQWIGLDKLQKLLIPKVNAVSQALMGEATDDNTNEFSSEDFIRLMAELSARGESMSDLQDQQAELLDQLDTLDMDIPGDLDKIKKIMAEVKTIKNDIAKKKRTRAEKVEPVTA